MIAIADVWQDLSAPLLTWAYVVGICALVLVAVAFFLWWQSNRKQLRRLLRGGAAFAAIAAIGAAALMLRIRAIYQDYAKGVEARSPPIEFIENYERRLGQAIAFYQVVGWAVIGLTAAILLLGALAGIRAARAAPRV